MHKPFFVYGTLLNGFNNYERYLKGKTIKEIPATTPGILGVYQGLPTMLEGDGEVHGELMFIPNELYSSVLFNIDRLEGYSEGDATNSLYVRKTVRAIAETGELFDAWAYIWNMFKPLDYLIKHGNLKRFIAET